MEVEEDSNITLTKILIAKKKFKHSYNWITLARALQIFTSSSSLVMNVGEGLILSIHGDDVGHY